MVGPPLEQLVPSVLQLVLSPLVEFDHHFFDSDWVALVSAVLEHLLVELVSHQREWLRCRWSGDLPDKVVSKLVLDPRLLQEYGLGPHVEHSVVFFAYSQGAVTIRRAFLPRC